MEYKLLGRTGVQVSKFCFGTMSFGGDADATEAAHMYAACRDRGFNFFDTADAYSKGRSEEILGGLIAGHRDELVISSKCFNPTSSDINDRGGTRRHIPRAVEGSLKRLGTDRLDILFMHRFEEGAAIEETLRALEDLVRAGKVLYLGASNYAAWQIATSLGIADRRGWTRFDVIQPMYNLAKRQAEVEIFPLAEAETLLTAARLLCYHTLDLRDRDKPHTAEAAMCKWFAPKSAVDIIHQCLLTHGHFGYTRDLPHEQRLRDVIGLEIGDGTAQIMKMIIAREKIGRVAVQYAADPKS